MLSDVEVVALLRPDAAQRLAPAITWHKVSVVVAIELWPRKSWTFRDSEKAASPDFR